MVEKPLFLPKPSWPLLAQSSSPVGVTGMGVRMLGLALQVVLLVCPRPSNPPCSQVSKRPPTSGLLSPKKVKPIRGRGAGPAPPSLGRGGAGRGGCPQQSSSAGAQPCSIP